MTWLSWFNELSLQSPSFFGPNAGESAPSSAVDVPTDPCPAAVCPSFMSSLRQSRIWQSLLTDGRLPFASTLFDSKINQRIFSLTITSACFCISVYAAYSSYFYFLDPILSRIITRIFGKTRTQKTATTPHRKQTAPQKDQNEDNASRANFAREHTDTSTNEYKRFRKCCDAVTMLKKPISLQNQLRLYGLYKQATEGDCTRPKPSLLDLSGVEKWNSWQQCRGMTNEEARNAYIDYSLKLLSSPSSSFSDVQTPMTIGGCVSIMGAMEVAEDDEISTGASLSRAVADGNIRECEEILKRDPHTVNHTDTEGMTPLHFAVDRNHVELTAMLLKEGSNVNAVDKHGDTPLHVALIAEAWDVIPLLMQSLPDLSLKNEEGKRALDVAEESTNLDVITLLRTSPLIS